MGIEPTTIGFITPEIPHKLPRWQSVALSSELTDRAASEEYGQVRAQASQAEGRESDASAYASPTSLRTYCAESRTASPAWVDRGWPNRGNGQSPRYVAASEFGPASSSCAEVICRIVSVPFSVASRSVVAPFSVALATFSMPTATFSATRGPCLRTDSATRAAPLSIVPSSDWNNCLTPAATTPSKPTSTMNRFTATSYDAVTLFADSANAPRYVLTVASAGLLTRLGLDWAPCHHKK